MTNVLIIEDEKESSEYLSRLLMEFDEVKVIGKLDSIKKSIIWLSNNNHPDLLFLDVQLSDGISLDILKKTNLDCPVIFISAFDEFAIDAIKFSGLDYILKPITNLDLSKALIKYFSNQLKSIKRLKINNNQLSGISDKNRFLVKEGKQHILIKVEEIAYTYWSKYAFLKRFDGKSFIVNYSINQMEGLLPPELFIRINRQVLTNINAIESIYTEDSSYFINLLPMHNERIKISKDTYSQLKKAFG